MKTIDIHAHIISEETVGLMRKESSKVGPKITPVDADTAVYEVADVAYRPFPRGGYDLERRFKDMAASDVDMQAVSITPQTFLYDQDASLNATLARIQNEQECVRQVRALSISEADRATILGGQAAAMLAGDGRARRATAGS